MKKLFAIVSVLILSVTVFAADFSLGIQGALNFSSLRADPTQYDLTVPVIGGGLGIEGQIGITRNFAVQFEVAYNCQNGMAFDDGSQLNSITFSTIDIPLILMGTFRMGPGMMFIGTGPQVSFVVGDIKVKSGSSTDRESADSAGIFKQLFGIVTIMGYSIPAGPGSVDLGLRFNVDFSPLNYFVVSPTFGDLGVRMRLSPTIGYVFHF